MVSGSTPRQAPPTLLVCVDLPDLAPACGVLGIDELPVALDSSQWRDRPAPEAATLLREALGDTWDPEGAIAVVRPRDRLDLQLTLQSLAAIAGRERVIDLPVTRTSLSGAYAAALSFPVVRELAVPRGLVPALLRNVESSLSIAALLTGVSTVSTPVPTLGQQAWGYVYGTRFLVRRGRSDRLVPLRRTHDAARVARSLASPTSRLVASVPVAAPAWMHGVVTARHDGDGLPVGILDGDTVAAAAWGTNRVVEVVGAPARWRSRVVNAAAALQGRVCSWCANTVNAIEVCAVCADTRRKVATGSRRRHAAV